MKNPSKIVLAALACAAIFSAAGTVQAAEDAFGAELSRLQREWAAANYETTGKEERRTAFATLVAHAGELAQRYPQRVEAVAWQGIVLSTYAGEVSAMSAMKQAKAARAALERAAAMDPAALAGGVYASLGALYSKVPGGLVGFGDDALAAEYFEKALAIDSSNIDSNYFYGEYLLEHGDRARATAVLERALQAPPVADRPVFDAGRRAEIRALLAQARRD